MGSIEAQENLDHGPISKFPADDLRASQRFITSHNKEGKGVFITTDDGDHHKIMVRGKGVANIIYSTLGNPVDLANEVDVKYAKENEVYLLIHSGILSWSHSADPEI